MNKKTVRGDTPAETLYLNFEWKPRCGSELGILWWELFNQGLETDCMIWTGPRRKTTNNFGYFTFEGKTYVTHRLAVEEEYGYRPNKLTNLCGESLCINAHHWQETEMAALPNRGVPVARVVKVDDRKNPVHPWRVRLIGCQTLIVDYYYSTEQQARKAAGRLNWWARGYNWRVFTVGVPWYVRLERPSRLELISSPRFYD